MKQSRITRELKRSQGAHWHAEYVRYPVFSTFETNFCTKSENSPPLIGIAIKT